MARNLTHRTVPGFPDKTSLYRDSYEAHYPWDLDPVAVTVTLPLLPPLPLPPPELQ
jgi:hypothetical protein